ncbi:MAG TPA: hypothetical protein VID29_07045 [Solirubrobacteraceae bacterium]
MDSASALQAAPEAQDYFAALGFWQEWFALGGWDASEQTPSASGTAESPAEALPAAPAEALPAAAAEGEEAAAPVGAEAQSAALAPTAAALTAATATLVLSVSGGVVHWTPLGAETAYKVAVSNAPRGAAARSTTYFSQARVSGTVQSYAPALTPGETVYVGVSADGGLTWSASEATVSDPLAPVLSVSAVTVRWSPIASESSYRVAVSTDARGTTDRSTVYATVARIAGSVQSYTPTLSPGQTVYVGVTADGGANWSEVEAKVTAPLVSQAPVLHVSGDTISWTAIPGVTSYKLATVLHPTTTRETTYKIVTGTSVTPPAVPGQTVNYGLSAATPEAGPWAKEVTIVYPPSEPAAGETGGGTPPPPPPPPPPPSGKMVGTNDGAGWGSAAAQTIMAGHITWDRVELASGSNALAKSLSGGFHVLAVVGNVNDATPLSQVEPAAWGASVVSQIRANPGVAIAEAGNEMYLKGHIANPVQYGRMYLAAANALKAAGIHIPLLFNELGDYPLGSWSSPSGWSQDAHGGGWLRDAVTGVPGLAAAIRANGISTHPYGGLAENEADSGGVNAVAAQEALAQTVLGAIPPFFITEFGFDMSRCGVASYGVCSQQEQASKMRSAYQVFLADPHVAGIWWYQSHDDSTGQFGFMDNSGLTRPSFGVLSSFALAQGQ